MFLLIGFLALIKEFVEAWDKNNTLLLEIIGTLVSVLFLIFKRIV